VVAHVVLLKPRPDLTPSDRRAFVDAFDRAVRGIPTVRRFHVGRRVTFGAGYEVRMPDTADFLGVLEFDDLDGLQTYLRHPAHQALSRLFGELLASALVYDFELSPDGQAHQYLV
jgi:hypothetical protein